MERKVNIVEDLVEIRLCLFMMRCLKEDKKLNGQM